MVLSLFLGVTACSFAPGNLQSRHSTDLEARNIRRIAVLPPTVAQPDPRATSPFAAPPASESRSAQREAPELLARLLYITMAAMPDWQIVSDSEVRDISQGVPPGNELTRLKQIGEGVYADAVIAGRIQRYRERVGEEWGAKSPASVAFILDLVDVRRGDVIWTARFDETQKSLSENILALGEISQRGLRWLSAEQLTREGVKKAVSELHHILVRPPAS